MKIYQGGGGSLKNVQRSQRDGVGILLCDGWRDPARWPFFAIAFTHFACCAAHSGPIFHMVSYAVDCGIPALTAATLLGWLRIFQSRGKVSARPKSV